jgi:hypothetical protein
MNSSLYMPNNRYSISKVRHRLPEFALSLLRCLFVTCNCLHSWCHLRYNRTSLQEISLCLSRTFFVPCNCLHSWFHLRNNRNAINLSHSSVSQKYLSLFLVCWCFIIINFDKKISFLLCLWAKYKIKFRQRNFCNESKIILSTLKIIFLNFLYTIRLPCYFPCTNIF